MWLDALRAALLLWACELALVRVTSMPAPWPDVWKSALGLAALGLAAPLVLRRGRETGSPARRAPVAGLVGHAPLALVVEAILVPTSGATAGAMGRGIAVLAFAAVLALGAVRGRAGAPIPGPPIVLGCLAAAVVAAWGLAGEGLPPLASLALLGALWAVLAWLARRPSTLPVLVGLALVAVRWPVGPPATPWNATGPASGPDLLLLTVDTLRSDHAAEMEGHRALAAAGLEFPHVLASAPWTLPSMATAMTGVEPARHGAVRRGEGAFGAIRRDLPTLAERLAARGYDTAAVTPVNPFTDARFGFDRGFAVFDSARTLGVHALPRGLRDPSSARPTVVQLLFEHGLDQLHPVGGAAQLAARARAVRERRRDRPLFLWVHFFDCHIPYRHADETGVPGWRDLERAVRSHILADPYWRTAPGRGALLAAYRNEVDHVDRAILSLLGDLERETVVALFSDHGEEFFERGGFEHGHSFHREVTEVSLVLARVGGAATPLPGAGTRVETPVGHLDVLPTLLAALGAPDPALAGRDLAGATVEGAVRTSVNPLYGLLDRAAVRDGRWKAIAGPGERVRLYDRRRDPDERADVSATHAGVARELRGALAASADPSATADRDADRDAVLSDRDRAALRALGYLAD